MSSIWEKKHADLHRSLIPTHKVSGLPWAYPVSWLQHGSTWLPPTSPSLTLTFLCSEVLHSFFQPTHSYWALLHQRHAHAPIRLWFPYSSPLSSGILALILPVATLFLLFSESSPILQLVFLNNSFSQAFIASCLDNSEKFPPNFCPPASFTLPP